MLEKLHIAVRAFAWIVSVLVGFACAAAWSAASGSVQIATAIVVGSAIIGGCILLGLDRVAVIKVELSSRKEGL